MVLAPPVAAAAVLPPYDRLSPLPERGGLPPGAVIALLAHGAPSLAGLREAIPALRSRYRQAPVVLHVEALTPPALLAAPVAVRCGARGVITADAPLRPQLETVLLHPGVAGEDVVEWLGLRGLALSPVLATTVREIFDRAAAHSRVSRLLAEMGDREITVRHRFRKRGIASPAAWLRAARGLRAALAIQGAPADLPLDALAFRMGFADHSALSQLLSRAFRIRPGLVRGTLGWEWILERGYPLLTARRRRDRNGKLPTPGTLTG